MRCDCGSNSTSRDTSTGEFYCTKCGKILEENKVKSTEKRAFSQEEKDKRARTGDSFSYRRPFRSTTSQMGNLDHVSNSKKSQYYRLKRWNNRSENSTERCMKDPMKKAETLIQQLDLPYQLIEKVGRMYLKCLEEDVVEGRKREDITAAVVYIAARINQTPRPMADVADKVETSKKDLGKSYKYVCNKLDLSLKPVNPANLLPMYLNKLDIENRYGEIKSLVDRSMEDAVLVGLNHKSIAAGAIYYLCFEEDTVTQKRISEVIGVTMVTVRKTYQLLEDEYGEIQVPKA